MEKRKRIRETISPKGAGRFLTLKPISSQTPLATDCLFGGGGHPEDRTTPGLKSLNKGEGEISPAPKLKNSLFLAEEGESKPLTAFLWYAVCERRKIIPSIRRIKWLKE